MHWNEIKTAIIDDIKNSDSGNAAAKLQALQKIETILEHYYPSYLQSPDSLLETTKEVLKLKISEKKGRGLTNYEKGIINSIFEILSPSIKYSEPRMRYKVEMCPNCFISLTIPEDLWDADFLACPQ